MRQISVSPSAISSGFAFQYGTPLTPISTFDLIAIVRSSVRCFALDRSSGSIVRSSVGIGSGVTGASATVSSSNIVSEGRLNVLP